jgi:endo-1,4-beta-xylanase
MKQSRLGSVGFVVTVLATALAVVGSAEAERPALKAVFQSDFLVGTALSNEQALGRDPAALELVAREFNTITSENMLKWEGVHPEPGRYDFTAADKFVEFGEKHGMFLVGHTLLWHNQTPAWAFAGVDGQALDRETALGRIQEHIKAVVGRYRGRIDGWDVVNEAIDDEGRLRTGPVGPPWRRGEPWHAAIGDDYIEKAFEFAHAADPDAELYYNDFNEWHPAKVAAICELIKSLKSKGIRIDGLGLQGHWGLDYPTLEEMDRMFTEYGKLGVKLMITELDINLLPDPGRRLGAEITRRVDWRKDLDPYRDELPADVQRKLAERYAAIFAMFLKHADKIDRVTFWGVHDGHSWLNYWPVDRTNYPLLFDRNLRPKPALKAVIETATRR